MVLYRRDEAAGKEALPSGAYGLQARREAPYFWRGKWEPLYRNGGQKYFWLAILSSTAAGLRVPFYLASTSGCKEKVHLRLGTGFASGVTWGFSPVCQVSCRFPHKPAPQERGDCSLRSQTPLAAAPLWGLPARYFVCRQNIQACGRISRFFIGGYSALSHAYRFVPI